MSFTATKPRAPGQRGLGLAAAIVGAALSAMPLIGCALGAGPAAAAVRLPNPAIDVPAGRELQTAVLSGGCFWGIQGVFEHVKGVKKVLAGYAGGKSFTAHYEMVGTGTTGHAESVQIVFDPHQITYGQILRIFFSVATDPTQVDQQFPDDGPQYRSEIFYVNAAQKSVASAYIRQLNAAKVFSKPIAALSCRI